MQTWSRQLNEEFCRVELMQALHYHHYRPACWLVQPGAKSAVDPIVCGVALRVRERLVRAHGVVKYRDIAATAQCRSADAVAIIWPRRVRTVRLG